MNSPIKKVKTNYEAWAELPSHVVGEIIGDELHASPRPTPRHANSCTGVVDQIRGPFHNGSGGGPGGWIILFEPEIHMDENIFVPDIAGWKRERMPQIPDEAFFTKEPDWICEVLSPSTAALDRVKKMPLYANLGVKFFWLVDPLIKTVEIYKNDHINWLLLNTFSDDKKVRAAPFDAIEIDLSVLWK